MCQQRYCPHCHLDFTDPASIIRCLRFQMHEPPLNPRLFVCPSNKWTKEEHPNGFHPGNIVCPHKPGPNDSANLADNIAGNGFVANLHKKIKNHKRDLAPAPAPRPKPSPAHEANRLYVRPGDLFKPGMWRTVSQWLKGRQSVKEDQQEKHRAEEQKESRAESSRARKRKREEISEGETENEGEGRRGRIGERLRRVRAEEAKAEKTERAKKRAEEREREDGDDRKEEEG